MFYFLSNNIKDCLLFRPVKRKFYSSLILMTLQDHFLSDYFFLAAGFILLYLLAWENFKKNN